MLFRPLIDPCDLLVNKNSTAKLVAGNSTNSDFETRLEKIQATKENLRLQIFKMNTQAIVCLLSVLALAVMSSAKGKGSVHPISFICNERFSFFLFLHNVSILLKVIEVPFYIVFFIFYIA